ncbi:MAG: hypothetical protein NVSMB7_04930 [Chitinophagaceae bacterium]
MRLHISSHPFDGKDFKQELQLASGGISITGGHTKVTIWVDVFRPVIHLDIQSARPVKVTASYESWRYEDHMIRGTEFRASSYKVPQTTTIKTYKDSIAFNNKEIWFCHRNLAGVKNIFDYTVRMEGMEAVKAKMFDPITSNTFGGSMNGEGMIPAGNDTGEYANTKYKSWILENAKPLRSRQMEIGLYVAQAKTQAAWSQGFPPS